MFRNKIYDANCYINIIEVMSNVLLYKIKKKVLQLNVISMEWTFVNNSAILNRANVDHSLASIVLIWTQ